MLTFLEDLLFLLDVAVNGRFRSEVVRIAKLKLKDVLLKSIREILVGEDMETAHNASDSKKAFLNIQISAVVDVTLNLINDNSRVEYEVIIGTVTERNTNFDVLKVDFDSLTEESA